MPRRTSVLVVIVLSLTIAANAQERTEKPDVADAPASVTPQKRPDRVFGVLSNYGTVEDATAASAITTKASFRMAALNSFDPYVFPFVGAIAAVAQLIELECQEDELPLALNPKRHRAPRFQSIERRLQVLDRCDEGFVDAVDRISRQQTCLGDGALFG
jgi:hypothetical protein